MLALLLYNIIMPNDNLHTARIEKNDEFYTRMEDIQRELNHYTKHFEHKTVLCNCDDPFESNFCKFFLRNFNFLKLKRLICTSYSGSPVIGKENEQLSLFDEENQPIIRENGYVLDIKNVPMKNGRGVSDDDIRSLLNRKRGGVKKLQGDGSFNSPECLEYLKEADIVVTNPPFSKFRMYIALLMEYKKDFLILGNMNAIAYTEVFPLIKDGKMWTGFKHFGGGMDMIQPKETFDKSKTKSYKIDKNGNIIKNIMGIIWYTNLDIDKRHENLVLYEHYYDENGVPTKEALEKYPKICNYDAINVDRINEIPCDYYDLISCPITFVDKHNPDQFEIIGCADANVVPEGWKGAPAEFIEAYYKQGGTGQYQEGNRLTCMFTHDGQAKIPYKRILIKRKNNN